MTNGSACAALCIAVLAAFCAVTASAQTLAPSAAPSALLAIDQNRGAVVDATLNTWRAELTQRFSSGAAAREAELRDALFAMRADQLLLLSLMRSPVPLAPAAGGAADQAKPTRT